MLVIILQVNRDPIAAEMQRMRQQLELLQGELVCARAVGSLALDTQVGNYHQQCCLC